MPARQRRYSPKTPSQPPKIVTAVARRAITVCCSEVPKLSPPPSHDENALSAVLSGEPELGCRVVGSLRTNAAQQDKISMPILLWLLGVPLSVIILLMLFGFLR